METKNSMRISLLTENERNYYLEVVEKKLTNFDNLLETIILKQDSMKLNCLTLYGPQGVGKTHMTMKVLNSLLELRNITGLKYFMGSITKVGLFNLLEENSEFMNITVLDDCDVILNHDCHEILKAATDTKSSEKSRVVTYATVHGDRSFVFDGFLINLTNEDYYKYKDVHTKAILDRMHIFKLDISKYDIFLRNTYLAEKFLNEEFDGDESIKLDFALFFQTEIREFVRKGIFDKLDLSFSLRFVNKILDLYPVFGDGWKTKSLEYQMLRKEHLSQLEFEKSYPLLANYELPTVEEDARTSVEDAISMGWKTHEGIWYKPKSNPQDGFEMYDELYTNPVELVK